MEKLYDRIRRENTNKYAFTGRNKKENSHNKANPIAGIPLVVMLAMAPMADGKQPAQIMLVNSEQVTELVAQVNSAAPERFYAQATTSTKGNYPLGVKYLSRYTINHIHKGKGNGVDAHFVFTASYGDKGRVGTVKYIDNNFINKTPDKTPPMVVGLVYHDLGADKEFCSIKVMSFHYDKTGNLTRMITSKEVDDETAQLLIDLLAGDTKWKNDTEIKFYESKSATLAPPQILD